MFNKKKNKKIIKKKISIDPEQAFIDVKNLPDFDNNKFEGVFEKPLGLFSFYTILFLFFIIFVIFLFATFNLQLIQGENYKIRSLDNFTKKEVLFSDRGVIFDRYKVPLVWNEFNNDLDFSTRKYIEKKGFSHLLGFVSYPQKDTFGKYFEKEYVGKAGMERYLNERLNGVLGKKVFKIDARGNILSKNTISLSEAGTNIKLTIDARVQEKLSYFLANFLEKYSFQGGAGVIMNIKNGEIIAMTSFPEYDSNVLTIGKDRDKIIQYTHDINKPFLNRVLYAEFTPGSIVKPFVALAALQENIITPYQKIHTDGKLIIPNPWNPDLPTVFKDWKNHGTVNLFSAIANSSNIYFYKIGGGFKKISGLGIDNIYSYLKKFGFGEKTNIQGFQERIGNVPNKEWKENVFQEPWLLGDTYYTAIGQYGFLTTPIQAVVATAALANNGKLIRPQVVLNSLKNENIKYKKIEGIDRKHFATVKKAMRETVLSGTTQSLNFNFLKVATKSGTAQTTNKKKNHSWVIGFWPYENPRYAFVVLAEKGPEDNETGVSLVASQLLRWMYENKLTNYF